LPFVAFAVVVAVVIAVILSEGRSPESKDPEELHAAPAANILFNPYPPYPSPFPTITYNFFLQKQPRNRMSSPKTT
jgi:hypothetical protein